MFGDNTPDFVNTLGPDGGNDVLDGGVGDDILRAGPGNDALGGGPDTLTTVMAMAGLMQRQTARL